ncbi:MAG: thiol reductant ABC exporter subunit CydC, partial [Gluconacetobacter diazotrophicus]|nr:thiol reductant ABC exporter subunit CydC [Gluconacetobacter diazotrophicus]
MSAPAPAPTSARASRAPILAILALWRPHALGLLGGLLVSLLAFGAGLALLGASGLRLAGTGAGLLLASAVLLRLLGAGRVLLRYAERMATHDAMFRALADLRLWFFRRLAGTAAGGIGFRRSGDLLSRLVGDVEALDGLYLRILLPFVAALLALPVIVVLAGRWSSGLAISLGVLFAVSAFVLPSIAAAVSAGEAQHLSRHAAALRTAVLDLVAGAREVRAFDAGHRVLLAAEKREDVLLSTQRILARRTARAGAASFLCQQLAVLLVLMAVAGSVFTPVPAIAGTLLLFVLLATFEVSAGLVRAGSLFGHVSAAAARVTETAEPSGIPEQPPVGPLSGTPASGAVLPVAHGLRIDDLGFRWRSDRAPVFEHLSLDIPPGAHVALLGPSGAGKSTLVSLLLRIVEPSAGSIALGGVPLSALDPAALRTRFAWLGQDTHLFADTVRANLLLGRPDADEPALWRALDQAQLSAVVRALPDGLDTWLGEGGSGLSGGQARRLALARALLSPAPILLLDEPAAGLDAATERELLSTVGAIGGERTVVLIVHRLTGAERLDRIWRLAGGRAS